MNEKAQEIIDYIVREVIRRPDKLIIITEDTPLVSGGLIDSFALVVILQKVEDVTHMRIPAGKIRAKDMDTVKLMLETAERVGKPRK
jgi:acyl carrier protein